jgi:hypothetical protein
MHFRDRGSGREVGLQRPPSKPGLPGHLPFIVIAEARRADVIRIVQNFCAVSLIHSAIYFEGPQNLAARFFPAGVRRRSDLLAADDV